MQVAAQLVGIVVIVLLVVAGAYLYLSRARRPDWIEIGGFLLRTRRVETFAAVAAALLIVAELAAYGFGQRKDVLQAVAEQARLDRLRGELAGLRDRGRLIEELQRRNKELETRRAAEQAHSAAKIARLEQALRDAQEKLAELERARGTGLGLTQDEKQTLIAALKPFPKQKVAIAALLGNDDAKRLSQDFVEVFDAADWDYGGEGGISVRQWDRDPVGVEVTLNEADARAGRIPSGIGELINVVRRLGLTLDNTIYMSSDVPSGQVLLKIGKRLRK